MWFRAAPGRAMSRSLPQLSDCRAILLTNGGIRPRTFYLGTSQIKPVVPSKVVPHHRPARSYFVLSRMEALRWPQLG